MRPSLCWPLMMRSPATHMWMRTRAVMGTTRPAPESALDTVTILLHSTLSSVDCTTAGAIPHRDPRKRS